MNISLKMETKNKQPNITDLIPSLFSSYTDEHVVQFTRSS